VLSGGLKEELRREVNICNPDGLARLQKLLSISSPFYYGAVEF
jgi:hypothetical protein